MSQHHVLQACPETCHWGFFDAGLKPVLSVASGDTVAIDSVSGGPDVLPQEGRCDIEKLPAIGGPIVTEGRAEQPAAIDPFPLLGPAPAEPGSNPTNRQGWDYSGCDRAASKCSRLLEPGLSWFGPWS